MGIVKIYNLFKYFVRFLFLQIVITYFTIWFFDNYLIFSSEEKFNLFQNLLDDRNRFLPFIPIQFVTVDTQIESVSAFA